MATIQEILQLSTPALRVAAFKNEKNLNIPCWDDIVRDYDPKQHDIIKNKARRPNDKKANGKIEKVAKITYPAEKIVTRRMAQMAFTIPVERKYDTGGDKDLETIAKSIESIFDRVRINGVNFNRFKAYFASCEMCTVWYAVKSAKHEDYGFPCEYRLKCRSYSPMPNRFSKITQANLYPIFDDYENMTGMCVEYTVYRSSSVSITYFDAYTSEGYFAYVQRGSQWEELPTDEIIAIDKIPIIYIYRPLPIFDDVSNPRDEIEFSLSRESDIIRKNSSPIISVKGELIGEKPVGDSAREVYQFRGSDGGIDLSSPSISQESTKHFVDELKDSIEEITQLADMSMKKMVEAGGASGESRKVLMTDSHLKVGEESHDIIWFLDREINVVKAFLAKFNTKWESLLPKVKVTNVIHPFVFNDATEKTDRLTKQVDGKLKSRKTAIKELGDVKDVDAEIAQIDKESESDSENNRIESIFRGAQ